MLLASLLAASVPGWALSDGAGASFIDASSPWAGVGSLNVNGNLFTATLIAPGYALTAAHVVAGADVNNMSFQTQGGLTYTSGVSAVFVNPGYTGGTAGNAAGDPTAHADLAILRLSNMAPHSLPRYAVYNGGLLKQTVNLVSYGRNATQATTGANKVDWVLNGVLGQPETYLMDHDGPDLGTNRIGASTAANGTLGAQVEAGIVAGDSGSAAFVQVNGQWQLAGINTFAVQFTAEALPQGAYGTGGGGIVLAGYQPWIQTVIASPVPEPGSAWMLLGGLALLAGARPNRVSRPTA